MPGIGRQARRLATARMRANPLTGITASGIQELIRQAQEGFSEDPAGEQMIEEAARARAAATVSQANAGQPQTAATAAGQTFQADRAVGTTLLAREGRRVRQELAAFQRLSQGVQQAQGSAQGGFAPAPVEALISARASLQAAQLQAQTQRDLSRFGLFSGFVQNIPGAVGLGLS